MTERLRELLAAATPGPWTLITGIAWPNEANPGVYVEDLRSESDPHAPICTGHDYDDHGHIGVPDAAYIAACDPDTIRDLLDAHDRMAGALAFIADWAADCGSTAEFDAAAGVPTRLFGFGAIEDRARAALAVPKEET